jgi:hypothetical protein
LEGEEDGEFPVVLEGAVLAAGLGLGQGGLPAGRHKPGRGAVWDVASTLGVHGLEQVHGVEDLAGGHAGGEAQGGQDVGGEGTDVTEAGVEELQAPALGQEPFVVAADGSGEPVASKASQPRPHRGVIEVLVQDHVEDVIEQYQPFNFGFGDGQLPFPQDEPGPPVGAGQGLVEHAHDLVDDLPTAAGQGGEEDRVAPLGGHGSQGFGRGASRQGGQLPDPLGRDAAEVEVLGAPLPKMGQFGDLGLDRLRCGADSPLTEPYQGGDTPSGVGHQQGVEYGLPFGGEQRAKPPVDFLQGGHPALATARMRRSNPARTTRSARRWPSAWRNSTDRVSCSSALATSQPSSSFHSPRPQDRQPARSMTAATWSRRTRGPTSAA